MQRPELIIHLVPDNFCHHQPRRVLLLFYSTSMYLEPNSLCLTNHAKIQRSKTTISLHFTNPWVGEGSARRSVGGAPSGCTWMSQSDGPGAPSMCSLASSPGISTSKAPLFPWQLRALRGKKLLSCIRPGLGSPGAVPSLNSTGQSSDKPCLLTGGAESFGAVFASLQVRYQTLRTDAEA